MLLHSWLKVYPLVVLHSITYHHLNISAHNEHNFASSVHALCDNIFGESDKALLP